MSKDCAADGERALESYFSKRGLLLCNKSNELPYLESVGGDWGGIVALIERGSVFYSKLYRKRTSYLSREFYAQVRVYRRRTERLSDRAREIYAFLCAVGPATSSAIKAALMLTNKDFNRAMDELFCELFVTALHEDRSLNVNWSSFVWGTYEDWEKLHPVDELLPSKEALENLTQDLLDEKQLAALLK